MKSIALAAALAAVGVLSVLPARAHETGIASIHAWVNVRGKTCMLDHFHDGSGTGPNRKAAELAAIRSWEAFTVWEYGDVWGRFRHAETRTIQCEAVSDGMRCEVRGRPCRPGALARKR